MKRRFTKYPSNYVRASEDTETSSEYMTPEQSAIIDKIRDSNRTIAMALVDSYKQSAELDSAGKYFAEGQISGMAFAVFQMGIIGFSEYCTLSGI